MPNYQRAAERAARRYGLNPRIFKRMIRQESGFNPNARSPAGAQGIAQFMPATARQYGVTLGDNRAADDLDGAARYLRDNLNKYGSYHAALSVYNSGRPDAYKDPSFAGGQTYNYVRGILRGVKDGGGREGPSGVVPAAVAQGPSYRTVPGVDNSATRAQLMQQYFSRSHDPDALLQLKGQLEGAADVPSRQVRVRSAGSQPNRTTTGEAARVAIAAGADRPGVKTSPEVIRFLRRVSRLSGRAVKLGTGSNHSQYTVNGNVSDHWTGHAGDVPATGRRLIDLGRAALIAAGMPRKQALRQRGGLYNVGRYQIIFNTQEGGDHTNHLHVGVH